MSFTKAQQEMVKQVLFDRFDHEVGATKSSKGGVEARRMYIEHVTLAINIKLTLEQNFNLTPSEKTYLADNLPTF